MMFLTHKRIIHKEKWTISFIHTIVFLSTKRRGIRNMELCKELNLSELFKEESLYNYQNENVVITHTLEILI